MSSLRNTPKQRLSQVQRHFSATTAAKQEIQEAYIISASRTPTAKVQNLNVATSLAHSNFLK
jgi:acetyl-CoA C-acetyltransferase